MKFQKEQKVLLFEDKGVQLFKIKSRGTTITKYEVWIDGMFYKESSVYEIAKQIFDDCEYIANKDRSVSVAFGGMVVAIGLSVAMIACLGAIGYLALGFTIALKGMS